MAEAYTAGAAAAAGQRQQHPPVCSAHPLAAPGSGPSPPPQRAAAAAAARAPRWAGGPPEAAGQRGRAHTGQTQISRQRCSLALARKASTPGSHNQVVCMRPLQALAPVSDIPSGLPACRMRTQWGAPQKGLGGCTPAGGRDRQEGRKGRWVPAEGWGRLGRWQVRVGLAGLLTGSR